MPVAACLHPHSCLARRDEVFRKDTIWTRDHECTSCTIGTARRMCDFTPDADIVPSPQRDLGKPRVKRPNATCSTCGKKVTPYAKQCKPCRGKARTALMPKYCVAPGCRWKARRGGLCMTHWFKKKKEEKLCRSKAQPTSHGKVPLHLNPRKETGCGADIRAYLSGSANDAAPMGTTGTIKMGI
jgi:hypothetical protein